MSVDEAPERGLDEVRAVHVVVGDGQLVARCTRCACRDTDGPQPQVLVGGQLGLGGREPSGGELVRALEVVQPFGTHRVRTVRLAPVEVAAFEVVARIHGRPGQTVGRRRHRAEVARPAWQPTARGFALPGGSHLTPPERLKPLCGPSGARRYGSLQLVTKVSVTVAADSVSTAVIARPVRWLAASNLVPQGYSGSVVSARRPFTPLFARVLG